MIAMIVPPDTVPNTTEIIKIADSMTSAPITIVARTLVRSLFTQGPRTSLSLHSSSRNTVALGSSTPARTWTPSVSSPSGDPGSSTTAAASAISAAYIA